MNQRVRLPSSHAIAMDRRAFLRGSLGLLSSASLRGALLPATAGVLKPAAKTVVVTFGGGARDEETFAEEGQENIPHLLTEL